MSMLRSSAGLAPQILKTSRGSASRHSKVYDPEPSVIYPVSFGTNVFSALRRNANNIIDLVSMMGRDSKMPCYGAGVAQVASTLRQRFQLQLSADEAETFVETDMIGKSLGATAHDCKDALAQPP